MYSCVSRVESSKRSVLSVFVIVGKVTPTVVTFLVHCVLFSCFFLIWK